MTDYEIASAVKRKDAKALAAEVRRLKEVIQAAAKNSLSETCGYCNRKVPELALCCYDCYIET